jgi:hypothetical protein
VIPYARSSWKPEFERIDVVFVGGFHGKTIEIW